MKLYLASSWRNPHQPQLVDDLRAQGHEVYDFRHPPGGDHLGFSWSDVDPGWRLWEAEDYVAALEHPIAVAGFESDWAAMQWADAGVLLLASGRSAHLEAGYFVGAGKPLFVLLDRAEYGSGRDGHSSIELMYRMATGIFVDRDDLLLAVYPFSDMHAAMTRRRPPVLDEGLEWSGPGDAEGAA
jgi:hypothetical protein